MNISIGDKLHGFTVERIRDSAELSGRLVEMRHASGAELLWVDNGESNKVFCVGFKTLPEDHTGVFHILEHSVLCGSRKYQVREPFVDLLKSSLNTFLNAMTFQDKTIYPFSSRNEKDFLNLASVYLDAVFAPLSVVDPNAFRQEGWHLETDENGKPFFNGVVYNEMKGATSGIDDILYDGMNSLLFPDNCYGFNSGGDPEHIPELTYEEYCRLYKKYYHPSNARFYLDGAVPLDETLALIEEYISGAEPMDASHPIPMQESRKGEKTVYYEIAPTDDAAGKTSISFGRIAGSFSEKRRLMMADILCSLLAETNDSPLKRAILDAGLGEDVELLLADGTQQGILSLTVRNTDADKAPEIRKLAEKVIGELAAAGLDKTLLTAHLNLFAFRVKDMREPAGLMRCIRQYYSSLYGGDPLMYLEYDEDLEALHRGIEAGEFDALLKELFDFDKMSILTVLPSKTRGEELRLAEEARAEKAYAALSDEQKAALHKENDRLHLWQQTPDSEEKVKSIPVLDLSEISREPLRIPTEEREIGGVRFMYHAIPSNGITNGSMYFALSDLNGAELSDAAFMASLYSKLPTAKHSVSELQKLINTYIGKLRFEIRAASLAPAECAPYLAVYFSTLDENAEKTVEIVSEILTSTDFGDAQRIRENLLQTDEYLKQTFIMSGHAIGMNAVNSHYLSAAAAAEFTGGVAYRRYIRRLAGDADKEIPSLIERLGRLSRLAPVRSRLVLGAACTASEGIEKVYSAFVSLLPEGEPAPKSAHYESTLPARFGVRIPARASFAEKGVLFGGDMGVMNVAANVISLSHLWNRVRVQLGAYGCGLRVNPRGTICHYSFRDPSPDKSEKVYDEDSAFITAFCEGSESLEKFIISAIGNTEPLRAPAEAGAFADMECLSGDTYEKALNERASMLNTTREDLLKIRAALDDCAKNGAVCVIGSDASLAAIEGLVVEDL